MIAFCLHLYLTFEIEFMFLFFCFELLHYWSIKVSVLLEAFQNWTRRKLWETIGIFLQPFVAKPMSCQSRWWRVHRGEEPNLSPDRQGLRNSISVVSSVATSCLVARQLAAFFTYKEACLEQETDVWVFKETATAIPQRLWHWRLNRRSISQQNCWAVQVIKFFFIKSSCFLSTSCWPALRAVCASKLPSPVFSKRWNLDGDRHELLSAQQVWALPTPWSVELARIFQSGSHLIGWLID